VIEDVEVWLDVESGSTDVPGGLQGRSLTEPRLMPLAPAIANNARAG
jgi:hypothetical protein